MESEDIKSQLPFIFAMTMPRALSQKFHQDMIGQGSELSRSDLDVVHVEQHCGKFLRVIIDAIINLPGSCNSHKSKSSVELGQCNEREVHRIRMGHQRHRRNIINPCGFSICAQL